MGIKDIHHFRETIDAGKLLWPASTANTTEPGGVWLMRLSDFPIYQRFVNCFEFARLNKVTIEYLPKYNLSSAPSGVTGSIKPITGTLILAEDQIPLVASYAGATVITAAPTWATDGDSDANVTVPFAARCDAITATYVRGIENSKEKELYSKRKQSFYPCFYNYLLDNPIVNTTTQTFGSNASTTGCFERNIKKWVNIVTLAQGAATAGSDVIVPNAGPVYYGPVYAFDVNETPTMALDLFDVRMTYSMSFKRLKASIGNLT